jgi:P27 family predicted phage terminase small subunit
MGKRGPRKTPTSLRVLRGNPSRRPLPTGEPTPQPLEGDVAPPAWLEPAARVAWTRLAAVLSRCGLLTALDVDALAALCAAIADRDAARVMLQRGGLVVKTASGFPVVSPYWAIESRASERVRRLLIEFGMTPASRTNVTRATPPAPEPRNPLDKFLRR